MKILCGTEWCNPHCARIVGGTDGLLAVTQIEAGAKWDVTHVRSGLAFPGEFTHFEDAMRAAVCLWLWFPRKRLEAKNKKDIEHDLEARTVYRIMGLE